MSVYNLADVNNDIKKLLLLRDDIKKNEISPYKMSNFELNKIVDKILVEQQELIFISLREIENEIRKLSEIRSIMRSC